MTVIFLKYSDHFIKAIFPFSLPANYENIAIGDISGDIQSDRNKVLLLLEKEPDITAKRMSEQTGLSTRKNSRIIRELREPEVIYVWVPIEKDIGKLINLNVRNY